MNSKQLDLNAPTERMRIGRVLNFIVQEKIKFRLILEFYYRGIIYKCPVGMNTTSETSE